MSNVLNKLWKKFLIRPDIWFFCAFLATSTLSIRKVLYFYPINESFNEYTGLYIYLSDIFLFLTLLCRLFLLCNIKSVLSSFNRVLTVCKKLIPNCSTWNNLKEKLFINVPRLPRDKKMFHVEHFLCSWDGTFLWFKKTYQQVIHNYTFTFPLFVALFSFVSIMWSVNQSIAIFRSIKLTAFILLFFYVYEMFHARPVGTKCSTWNILFLTGVEHIEENKNVPRGTFLKNTLFITIIISLIQATVGILQFFIQHSLGLLWLKESIISTNFNGVAKIIFNGQTFIRAYGLFPHPNIFGGFLVFSIFMTLLYIKLFKFNSAPKKCSTWNILKEKEFASGKILSHIKQMFHVEHFPNFLNRTFILQIIVSIQFVALLLTFSKSAIIGLLMGLFYLYLANNGRDVPRGTFLLKLKDSKMFHVEHFKRKLILVASIFVLLFLLIKPDIHSLLFKSLQEREFYLNVSPARIAMQSIAGGHGTFNDFKIVLIGIGSGQSIPVMAKNYSVEAWQYQPVHNVFLLILNEFGIIILFLFLFFIYKIFHHRINVPPQSETNCSTPVQLFHVEQFYGPSNKTPSEQSIGNKLSEKTIDIYLKATLLSFTFIMLFDHYFWDIQQGQILLWFTLGMIAAGRRE